MRQHSLRQSSIHIFLISLILMIIGVSMVSFKTANIYGDFLKQLGITKQDANERIAGGFLGGGLDIYGIKNLKNILTNDRSAIVKDLAAYARQYASSPEYIAQYADLKSKNKPQPYPVQTPEELRATTIQQAKEAIVQLEESLKKAPSDMKSIFEKTLEAAKQNLKQAEDPNNKYIKAYTQNFPSMQKQMKELHERALADWEAKYPTNHLLYIKSRLQDFLDATEGIDFSAQLVQRNGKKYFVNPAYESKSYNWKLAFRAGKDAVETARDFAQQWMREIG